MPFYHFNQNNPGGVTHTTNTLADQVIIEADTPDEADVRLIALGGYFDGVSIGRDCPCCGDRWDHTHPRDASDTPWSTTRPRKSGSTTPPPVSECPAKRL